MLRQGWEPLTEPLDLFDTDGAKTGVLSVSLLAKDAIGRARRASLRGPGTLELWVGAESLLLAPALRSALSSAALWVEVHLEIDGHAPRQAERGSVVSGDKAAATLQVVSRRVRMPRGSASGSGLASALSVQLRGRLTFPAGSGARAGLQRSLKKGGADTTLAFFLYASTGDGGAARLPLAAARLPLVELLARANAVKAASIASAGAYAAPPISSPGDGVPLQVQLREGRGELLATLAADVEGLGALKALATDVGAGGG
jgi:hypothetical protein